MARIIRTKHKAIKTKFGEIEFITLAMKVKTVLNIYYVAVRGKDEEEGAIQRVLNKHRIKSIKDFVLAGNMFMNTFILNWTHSKSKPIYRNGLVSIPHRIAAAQVIDGQHRLAGLEEAVTENPDIGEQSILVSITIGLSTKNAAAIFLNINSEQKPVPRSLIYDLFGEVEDNLDHIINRANDIAVELNENEDSPYYGAIKYPGKPRGVGIIDLASVIGSLKKHLESGGIFAQRNLTKLQNQRTVILNYFTALKYYYDRDGIWNDKTKNPFLTSAGFYGAIEALANTFIPYCVQQKSFKISTFKKLLQLNQDSLLTREEVKQIEGRTRRKYIKEYLESNLLKSLPAQDDYEF